MPFTLSHPAVVLLFRGTGLPVVAMLAGSMAPDVPMFVPVPGAYAVTHSLVGVVTVDVVLSVLGVVVWFGMVRDALVDVAPATVRERLAPRARYSRKQWALVPLAVVLGSFSHVAWDAFTHQNRWGVVHVRWLHELHGGLPGHKWAQYVSGVLGLLVVGVWALASLRGLTRGPRPPRVPELARALATVLLATAAVGAVAALTSGPHGLHAVATRAAVLGTITLVVGLLTLAGTWQLLARHPSLSRI